MASGMKPMYILVPADLKDRLKVVVDELKKKEVGSHSESSIARKAIEDRVSQLEIELNIPKGV